VEDADMMLKNQKGAAAVEFAIIAPLLFVILFGIIEFSILLYDKAMLTNASREGARVGIVFSSPTRISNDVIVTAVRDYCEEHLISFGAGSDLDIDINPDNVDDRDPGDSLTVTVNYPFRFLAFSNLISLVGGNMENVFNLQAITVMRME
jgi:Flp pilus assembly protein TadG